MLLDVQSKPAFRQCLEKVEWTLFRLTSPT